mgnify:CR=1 FL=1
MCPETDILEQEKKAVADMIAVRAITPDNAVFERTGGGFVRMAFTAPNGTVKEYPRISVHRCFPFSDPDRYISIREPEAEIRAMCKQLLKKDEAIDTLKKSVGILSKP